MFSYRNINTGEIRNFPYKIVDSEWVEAVSTASTPKPKTKKSRAKGGD